MADVLVSGDGGNATAALPPLPVEPSEGPVIHLELEFRQVDTLLAVAYAGACFFSFWAFFMHWRSPARQAATLGFYLLMGLAALTRVVWFATPYGVMSVLVQPERIMMGDDGWVMFLTAEGVELVGTFLIYSIFVLIIVFWADMLRRLFTNGNIRSHPLKLFFFVLWAIVATQSVGFGLFALRKVDSFWLMIYDDIVLCMLSFSSLVSVLVYSYRMKTVLQAFLEVSQIDTTDRIKAVNWATSICAFFLIVNSLFLCYSIVSLAQFNQVGVYIQPKLWWLFVASKHLVEILVLYFLLYTLWGKSSDEAESKEGYEPIPDYLSDEETGGSSDAGNHRNGGIGSGTPRRL